MNRIPIPTYLIIALLGLVFISAGLVTMFADTGEVVPTEEPIAVLPSATLTETPTLTPTVYIPPTAVVPTLAPPTSVPVQPTIAEAQALPTDVVAAVPPPTQEQAGAGVVVIGVDPIDSGQIVPIPTALPPVEAGAAQGVPPTADTAPQNVVPTDSVPVDMAVETTVATVVDASASVPPTIDPNSVPADSGQPQPLAGDAGAQGAPLPETVPVLPTSQTDQGAVPAAPTTDPAVVAPIVPTSDPALIPTTDPALLPTSDPALVSTTDPALLPTSNPVLVPTVDTSLQTGGEVVATIEATAISLAQVTGVVTASNTADYSGILVMLTAPDGSTLQAVTDATGAFTFPNLAPGTYRVDAGAVGYLSRRVEFGLTDGQSLSLPPTRLILGDTNLDNVIDLTDAALIAANFDSPATVPEADINHDGWIDVRDLALLGADYGRSGPMSWE